MLAEPLVGREADERIAHEHVPGLAQAHVHVAHPVELEQGVVHDRVEAVRGARVEAGGPGVHEVGGRPAHVAPAVAHHVEGDEGAGHGVGEPQAGPMRITPAAAAAG